ncbi:MAG: glycoside hydrolase family 57 protein [bacterium]
MSKSSSRKKVCFYFQVHQPARLAKFHFFDQAKPSLDKYFTGLAGSSNETIIHKVAQKSYLPTNQIIADLLNKYPEFQVTYSISGVALEQIQEFVPELLKSFQNLVKTGQVELLNETYYHSISWLYSQEEFCKQVHLHRQLIWKLFKKKPSIFRNTELIYNNELGNFIRNLGFSGILAEGWDFYLQGKSPNYLYQAKKFKLSNTQLKIVNQYKFKDKIQTNLALLLKNYKLSDDIAFRFSNKQWVEYPLTAKKFVSWIQAAEGEIINLFMDYETFGEHQWQDSGIFEFLKALPGELLEKGIGFTTPAAIVKNNYKHGEIDMHNYVSWADMERDISAWLGNKMQQQAAKLLYECESTLRILSKHLPRLQRDQIHDAWRKLQTSDHFYYMSTKYWNDGDIHKYFSPYDSPYDAYINYMNVLTHFKTEMTNHAKILIKP